MALIVITISDTQDGQVGVSMITEPAIQLDSTDVTTPAQAAALRMIELLTVTPEQSIIDLNS